MNEAEYTSEMAEGLLSLGKKKLFGFAGVLSGVFGFIADVLQPIAPFALYLAIICAIGLLVSLCLYIKSKKGLTISIVLAVSTGVLGLLSAVQHFSGSTDKGWASKRIPGVSRFQESLGMLQETVDDIKTLSQATLDTSTKTSESLDDLRNTIDSNIINNDPVTAADFYNNAKLYELRGDIDKAYLAYKSYFSFETGKLDPHLRLAALLLQNCSSIEEASAEYSQLTKGLKKAEVTYTKLTLLPPKKRAVRFPAFREQHPSYLPIFYLILSSKANSSPSKSSVESKETFIKQLQKFTHMLDNGSLDEYFEDKGKVVLMRNDTKLWLKKTQAHVAK